MSKRKFIILRNIEGETRNVFAGPSPLFRTASPAPARLDVEVAELDKRSLEVAMHDTRTLAVAQPMPTVLIKPVNVSPFSPAASSNAWGVEAVGAHTSPFDGSDVTVAVIDTGIEPAHPAFAGVNLLRRNFTTGPADDQDGHGTHCAGTIFGRDISGMRIGVAPGVKRALIAKIFGPGGASTETVVKAMNWAVENGADVLSMSLGIDFPGYVKQLQNEGYPVELATSMGLEAYRLNVLLFERLAAYLRGRGNMLSPVMLVGASGNESRRHVDPKFEIATSPPAVAEGFVSVAAVERQGGGPTLVPASFSNTGASIAAPGVDIPSAGVGGGLRSMSGTSMATPHVAGVAALWAQKLKQSGMLNPTSWTSLLIASGSNSHFAPGYDPLDVGTGLVQAPQN